MASEQTKERVRRQFGGSAAAYAVSKTHSVGADLDRLVEIAECGPDVEALDIATGAGHTARAIAPLVRHVVLSDITPEMLDTACAQMNSADIHNVSFRLADAEDLPFDDETFDLVTCRIAPHHFPNVQQAVNEVARVLRPGGLFVMLDSTVDANPAMDAFQNELERRRDGSHVRSWTQAEWQGFFDAAGLTIESMEVFPKRHDFQDWTMRSRMSDAERRALEAWVLAQDGTLLTSLAVEVVDGRVVSFTDQKTLFKARKPVAM
jgi:ubiquinone/menaquinone biosynthesis C-methylase UbiE